MVILGVMASTDSLVRHTALLDPFGRDPKAFYLVPMSEMVIFAALLYFAFRNRKDSPAHKRYIYIATTSLMVAAIARWPLAFSSRKSWSPVCSPTFSCSSLSPTTYGPPARFTAPPSGQERPWSSSSKSAFPSAKPPIWHSIADWVIVHAS